MPLTVRAQRPIHFATSCLVIFLISLMGMQQLGMGLSNYTSQVSEQECSALLQLARQSNLSTNCNCTQLSSLKPCNGSCARTRQHFASCAPGGYVAVSELYLSNMGLKGNLKWVANFKHIKHLDVSLNHFSGNIPSSIWSLGKLSYVNLSYNSLSGHIPNFNDSMSSSTYNHPLKALDISHNQIGGPFPQNLCIRFPNLTQLLLSSNTLIGSANLSLCDRLEALDASFNSLHGSLLEDLQAKSSLKIITLQHNMLSGSIPSLSGLPHLLHLDVSFNNFSGTFGSENCTLPLNLSNLNVSHNNLEVGLGRSMIFNIGLSSFWPNRACGGCFYVMASSPSPSASAHMISSGAAASPSPSMLSPIKARVDAILGIIAGCIAALIFITIISCVLIRKHRQKTPWPLCPKRPVPPFKHVPELGPFSFESHSGTWVADVKDPSSVPVVIFQKPLMNLTFSDLLQATKSFDREFEVGDGTGLVYACTLPGVLEDGAKVTIEVVEDGPSLSAEAAHAAFTAMGKVKHDNLVPLLGYCIVGEEKLLIYKHMEGGSLEDVLHAVPEEAQLSNANAISTEDWSNMESWPDNDDLQSCALDTSKLTCIDWGTRHKIALGVARALAYLHNGCRRPVVHGAVSSSCILLDRSLKEAMVANYSGAWGLRRRLAPGYVAPECKESPHMAASKRGMYASCSSNCDVYAYTSKCDVYGVGVVLLELATGRRAVGNYGVSVTLVAWVRALTKGKRAEEAVDPWLPSATHPYLLEMIKVGYLCTADSPSKRPSMQQVVGLLKDLGPQY